MPENDVSHLAPRLKAVADRNRLRMLRLLKDDLCVGAIARKLAISDAAVSQHLKVLREAGLVRGEKRGYWTHYRLIEDELLRLAEELRAIAPSPPASGDANSCPCGPHSDGP